MERLIRNILSLVETLDDADFEFAVDHDVRTRSIGRRSTTRPRRRSPGTGKRRDASSLEGREKFRARRKIKRLNRLLKRAERKGLDIEDLVEQDAPLVERIDDPDGTGCTIVVDSAAAELEWNSGEDTVVVRCDEHTETVDVPFAVASVDRREKPQLTEFRLTP